MIKKILLFSLIPVSAHAHDSSLNHFQGGFIAELLHTVSHAHHAFGGLVIAIVALCAYKFVKTYQLKKAASGAAKK